MIVWGIMALPAWYRRLWPIAQVKLSERRREGIRNQARKNKRALLADGLQTTLGPINRSLPR